MGGPTELKGPGLVRDGIAAADLADGATVAGRALGKEVLLVHRGTRQRVELWVHARRQGQVAAQNIFGRRRAFTHLPSFWSAHYDLSISYAGRPEAWGSTQIAGSLERRDAPIACGSAGAVSAVATIGRGRVGLMAEEAMERGDIRALEALPKSDDQHRAACPDPQGRRPPRSA